MTFVTCVKRTIRVLKGIKPCLQDDRSLHEPCHICCKPFASLEMGRNVKRGRNGQRRKNLCSMPSRELVSVSSDLKDARSSCTDMGG